MNTVTAKANREAARRIIGKLLHSGICYVGIKTRSTGISYDLSLPKGQPVNLFEVTPSHREKVHFILDYQDEIPLELETCPKSINNLTETLRDHVSDLMQPI